MKNSQSLSMAELDNYDPQAIGRVRRLCPLCGQDKPKDEAHRSIQVEQTKGLWHCHRCKEGGQLREFWVERPFMPLTRRERSTAQMRQTFEMPSTPDSKPCDPVKEALWRDQLKALQSLTNSRSAEYLAKREIALEVAEQSGVRHLQNWFGRPAVVFPARDHGGVLVGAQGRYIDGRTNPKVRTGGSGGVFVAANAWAVSVLILTEAPLDALSLAMCGFPAVAAFGCSLPSWMHRRCAFEHVLLATDADDAGDKAAREWSDYLSSYGANCRRLRPEGAKDWNEQLQKVGVQDMRELLHLQVETVLGNP